MAADPHAAAQEQAEQMAQLAHHMQQQQLPPQPQPLPQPATAQEAALYHLLAQQQAQMQQQAQLLQMMQHQMQAPPPGAGAQLQLQTLALASLAPLEPYHGTANATDNRTRQWLAQVEHHCLVRENALNLSPLQGDGQRVATARNALKDGALAWYMALAIKPTTWEEFGSALLKRYGSLATPQVLVQQLFTYAQQSARVKDKLNDVGLARHATEFQLLANQIPASDMTDMTKRQLFIQGLPPRAAEFALEDGVKEAPLPLHELCDRVVARAQHKAYATGTTAAAPRRDHGNHMDVDAISLAAMQFGVSYEDAARYVEPAEGWAPHDTETAPPPVAGAGTLDVETVAKLCAMYKSGRFAPSNGSSTSSSGGPSSRRNVPFDVKKNIPEALVKERMAAGLCVKCGTTKYSAGAHGHNSRTCKLPSDTKTSAADGKKKAGF
jgi:hypothetical protein